jgi:catechol 2,3-dioxygenase-like lactoylglutathione lyase family enzyme
MIDGVQDIYLNVRDMDRAIAFYRDVLGMDVIDSDEWWTSLECGGLRIGLHGTDGEEVPTVGYDGHGPHAGACLTLRSTNIEADVEALKSAGTEVVGRFDAEWGRLAVFLDPDGNVLKLMEPTDG